MSMRGGAAAGSGDMSFSTPKLVLRDNLLASHIFIRGATGKYSSDINGLYSTDFLKPEPALTGRDGRVLYGRVSDGYHNLREMRIIHHDGYWVVKSLNSKSLPTGIFAKVQGGCALEECTKRVWQIYDEQGQRFHDQPGVKMFTGKSALVEQSNLQATDIFISGVEGVNSDINGPYSPTEERGEDGRVLYRKNGESGAQALCIEHLNDRWQVKYESDRGRVTCLAHVRGDCALEECCSRLWKVCDRKEFVDQLSVKILTGAEAASKASGHT